MNEQNDNKWISMIIHAGDICNLLENILQVLLYLCQPRKKCEDITMDSTKKTSVKLQLWLKQTNKQRSC